MALRLRRIAGAAASFAVFVASAPAEAQPDLRSYSDYPATARLSALNARLMSPLQHAQLQAGLAASHRRLAEQTIDLERERFLVYAPAQRPADGYRLLVFVPPWKGAARLPEGWSQVLDREGVIFVSAAETGNDANVLLRRMPLALIAADNVARAYGVDRGRVYVGGFSGGARVALRLALAYPDVFAGALLNAGSDRLGEADVILPPAELFQRFQETSRVVFVTGGGDTANLRRDAASQASLRAWCVGGVGRYVAPRLQHEVASAAALERGLQLLVGDPPGQAAALETCRRRLADDLASRLRQADEAIAAGEADAAEALLGQIDRAYGGAAGGAVVDREAALRAASPAKRVP